jgi:uncharacterized DUF497 family protein
VEITQLEYDGFDWDSANISKAQKHGITVNEIEEFFGQELLVTEDRKHSEKESRMIAAGLSRGKRPIFVAFTLRFRGELKFIRVISARYMHKKERELYESLKKTFEK